MNSLIPIIEVYDDSNEGPSAILEGSANHVSGDEESQLTLEEMKEEQKKANNRQNIKKIAVKLTHQYKRFEEKRKELKVKRDARLEDVNLMHQKLLSSLSEKIKCQNEYNHQYKRSIETSQAVWHSIMTSQPNNKQSRAASLAEELYSKDKMTNQTRKVERLGKELLEASEKRLKTLEEVSTMLTQELEEAKAEYFSLDKELVETVTCLEETSDILKTVKDFENDEDVAPFASCGMSSILSDDGEQTPGTESYTYKSAREVRRFVVEKRSTTLFPSFIRESVVRKSCIDPGSSSQSNRINQQRVEDRRRTFPSERALYQSSLSPKNSDKDTDDGNSSSSTYKFPYYHRKHLSKNARDKSSGQLTNVSDGKSPKKRGRPRKNTMMVKIPIPPKQQGDQIKRKPGRPRKYLKLELSGETPVVTENDVTV